MALARGAFIQLQVVHALVLRETRTRFGAHQLGYLWAVFEPLMWMGTFWGLYAVNHKRIPHDLDTVGFLATGIITYEMFSKTASRVGEAINGNKQLLFYPQVQPIDLMWARGVLEVSTLGAVFLVVMGGNLVTRPDYAASVDDALLTLEGLSCAALLGVSFGLVLGTLGVFSKAVERLRGPVMRPLFWVSGLFYTLDEAPAGARPYLHYNPVLHCVEMVRDGWFADYENRDTSATYVLGFVLVFLLVGLSLERVARRRLELT
jgi:capsular polysaccharide transport system permease protein